jgi:catechol 2,3-dioxygenase-like lactoylglutathione lyase family enzyme
MGHVVLAGSSMAEADSVMLDVFGMSVREDLSLPDGGRGHFFGCNRRHHSCAVVVDGTPPGVMHIMLELKTVDDVGCAYDRVRQEGYEATGLGRHRTDNMLSFYVANPAGFRFEIGCNGLEVEDDDAWPDVKMSTRARMWGHEGVTILKSG